MLWRDDLGTTEKLLFHGAKGEIDGEIDFHQLNNGPLFGDDTKEILDEVFSSRFKSC